MSNIIYKNGTVYQVSHDEGRTVNNVFEYDIKDHLGSLRVSFKDSVGIAKVTQESHTGVFGDVLPSLVYTNTPKTDNFDYTGHERLKAFNIGYIDAGARWIDPILGRFVQIDPLAETSRRWSPYTYAFNSPLMFIDPDGMENTGLPEQQPQNNGFEYSDGYQTHNSYENTGAVSFEGSYQNTGGEDKPKKDNNQHYTNHISNFFSFNLKKLKNYANGLSKSLFDLKRTNLIVYGNGKASDNFLGGEFKQGGKVVVMDIGKGNEIFWLMSIYAPSRRFDDGGIPNLIDLFGDNHPILQDQNFIESREYNGLYKNLSQSKYVGLDKGYVEYIGNYYLPVTTYNQNTAEYKYFLIGVSERQAKSGVYKEILKKYN